MIQAQARAKINWALNITGRRSDGYHLLDMVMQSIELHDTMTFEDADAIALIVDGDIPAEPEKNLVHRAATALNRRTGTRRGARITLEKRIPARAGLGGGSADCALTLRALNRLWDLKLSDAALSEIGAGLGADVPFFLQGGLCRVQGIGERVERLSPAPKYWLVIKHVSPGLSTPEVYREYDELGASSTKTAGPVLALLQSGDFAALGKMDLNALEAPAVRMLPAIAKAKRQLLSLGALHALMSGSGSAVYGVFAGEREARQAASGLEGALLSHTTEG